MKLQRLVFSYPMTLAIVQADMMMASADRISRLERKIKLQLLVAEIRFRIAMDTIPRVTLDKL